MYQVYNIEYYKIYDAKNDDFIFYAYSKDELIDFIVHCYGCSDNYNYWFIPKNYPYFCNIFILNCTTDLKKLNNPYRYIIYDNFNRIINVQDFEKEASKLFNIYKGQNEGNYLNGRWGYYFLNTVNKKRKKYNKYHNYSDNYEYRKDPVPYTHKYRGGPYQRGPRTAKIVRMYKNPEYKEFNRGSVTMIPTWWDDKRRTVQRSWKSQSKFRHQWEKNSVKNFL